MNYDAILAIFNCFKDKIKYSTPDLNIKKEIPEDVRIWYEELKETYNTMQEENPEKNISTSVEGTNGEACIYYITPREVTQRVSTNSSDKEKIMTSSINKARAEMIKETIYNYLATTLTGIEFLPFDIKQLEEQSVYECKATGRNSEQIKIDYDESTLKTNIKITTANKYLKISLLPEIISTRYDGMITVSNTQEKNHKSIFNIFKRKSRFEIAQEKAADFISVTKDEISSKCHARGTVYAEEGVYIFEITNNIFTINYFDQETINTITTTNLNKKFELTNFIKILRDKKELSNTDFIEKLEKTGLLPNATFSIPCTPKELQVLVNKSFSNPQKLTEELFKAQDHTK